MTELEIKVAADALNLPIELGAADHIIADLGARLNGLKADTPAKYQMVRAGIQEVRTIRTGVDKSRKDLKNPHVDFCRKVDTEARRLTDLLLEIEVPLKDEKARVDDEKERIKKEKAEKHRLELESKELAEKEAREAKELAERQAEAEERERLRLIQEQQQADIEAERAALEKLKEEQLAELNELRQEKEEIKLQKEELEQQKEEREQQKRDVELPERDVELPKREEAEAIELSARTEEGRKLSEAADAEFQESIQPDREAIDAYFIEVFKIDRPKMTTEWGERIYKIICEGMHQLADDVTQRMK